MRPRKIFLLLFFTQILCLPALNLALAQYAEGLATVHYAPSRTYDIQHMKLEISLDEVRKTVSGKVTFTLTP